VEEEERRTLNIKHQTSNVEVKKGWIDKFWIFEWGEEAQELPFHHIIDP
jgi:hypothetical protein